MPGGMSGWLMVMVVRPLPDPARALAGYTFIVPAASQS